MNNSQQGHPDPSRPDIDAAENLALEARKAALLDRLRELKPEDFEAWKEEIRQSRLHDWEDDDDEEEVNRLAEMVIEQEDNGTIEA